MKFFQPHTDYEKWRYVPLILLKLKENLLNEPKPNDALLTFTLEKTKYVFNNCHWEHEVVIQKINK